MTLSPNSDHSFTEPMHHLLTAYLRSVPSSTIELCSFPWAWTGSSWHNSHCHIVKTHPPSPITLNDLQPQHAAWKKFLDDYTPSNHPSFAACTPLVNKKPPPAILAAISSGNHLISSTIFRLTTGHCFNADYSNRFCPSANDNTECLCMANLPPHLTHNPPRHTCHYIIFHCPLSHAT
jgi:hypothetical protein